jgi:hypothetical protein
LIEAAIRALSAVLLAAVAGLAFAPPVPVLTLTDGVVRLIVPVREGETYTYSYVSSIYNAPVEETHLRDGDKLKIASVASPDVRAVEYFRWDGEPRLAGAAYVQAAPANEGGYLLIRVTPQYNQRLAGAAWTVDLAESFGDGRVRVVPQKMPQAVALLHGWRP